MNPLFDELRYPLERSELFNMGVSLVVDFCVLNDLPIPMVRPVPTYLWSVGACAYYRPGEDEGIWICVQECQRPTGKTPSRNWSWPGHITDRTPYGVIAHELGHHVDWLFSEVKGLYYGDFSERLMKYTKEKPITSYAPNHAEWFAEMFRLFCTNPNLLKSLRPKTYEGIAEKVKPLYTENWDDRLGSNCPPHIVSAARKKLK